MAKVVHNSVCCGCNLCYLSRIFFVTLEVTELPATSHAQFLPGLCWSLVQMAESELYLTVRFLSYEDLSSYEKTKTICRDWVYIPVLACRHPVWLPLYSGMPDFRFISSGFLFGGMRVKILMCKGQAWN